MMERHARFLVLSLAFACTALIAAPGLARAGVHPANGSFPIFLPIVTVPVPSIEQQVVDLVNLQRATVGCPPLTLSPQLSAAAQDHSRDMALNDFFSHSGSDGSTMAVRITQSGYNWQMAAENIAVGYATPQQVIGAWTSSVDHRRNLLDCQLRDIGIGYYNQSDDQPNVRMDNGTIGGPFFYYWTQDFGTPN